MSPSPDGPPVSPPVQRLATSHDVFVKLVEVVTRNAPKIEECIDQEPPAGMANAKEPLISANDVMLRFLRAHPEQAASMLAGLISYINMRAAEIA